MKTAIMYRGPMRPDAESVSNTIKFFQDNNLKDFKCDEFVFTWSGEECEKLKKNNSITVIDYEKPKLEYIKTLISIDALGNGCPAERPFWQYEMQKKATQHLYDLGYDFIVMTRVDIDVALKPNISEWCIPNTYSTFGSLEDNFYTDMFAVADAKTMRDAWNFENYECLNEMFKKAYRGEDPLCMILKDKKITVKDFGHPWKGNFHFYINPSRRMNENK